MLHLKLRWRVACVIALVAVAAAALASTLGFGITIRALRGVSRSGASHVAVMMASELESRGVDPTRLASDPAAAQTAERILRDAVKRLNFEGDMWTLAGILVPEGDQWRLVATGLEPRVASWAYKVGDRLSVTADDPSQALSVDRPVGGWYDTGRAAWFGAAAPLGAGSGIVAVAVHQNDIEQFVDQVKRSAMMAMAIAIALGLLLGIWGGRLIVRPIEEVRAFAARLGRRDYGARVAERGAPEIRQMLRDMNALATVLRERDERLVERTVSMAELRDPRETAAHVKRVSGVSGEIFDGWVARHPEAAGAAAFDRDRLVAAALMHDIGKVGVPDGVLKKPGKLDDAEYICMKRHTVLGASRLLDRDPFDDAARDVVLHHQERWDGRGYPGAVDAATLALDAESLLGLPMDRPGLAGTDIPLFARIVAIADVYDALRSRRAYKEPWSEEKVRQTIRDDAGKAFDPELVQIFDERYDRIRAVWAAHPDDPPVTSSAPAPAP